MEEKRLQEKLPPDQKHLEERDVIKHSTVLQIWKQAVRTKRKYPSKLSKQHQHKLADDWL